MHHSTDESVERTNNDGLFIAGQFRIIGHRSHSFSIQRNPVWHFVVEYREFSREKVHSKRFLLCRSAEYETHFHLRQSSLRLLFAEILLFE